MSGEYEQRNWPVPVSETGLGQYGSESKRISLRDETAGQLRYHEKMVEVKRELLKLLDENPAIERFMDLSRQ